MSKFYIYTKDKAFYITDGKIYLLKSILFIAFLIDLFYFSHKDYGDFYIFLVSILCIFSFICMFLNVTSYYRYRPLEGRIKNEIELKETEIIIRNERIKIEEIKNIEITNDDFLNFRERHSIHVIIGRKSYGVNNEIKITLNDNKVLKINYQQDNDHDMQNSNELLKHYYSKGIISIENLLYVLGIVDEDEKNQFKRTLE